MPEQQNTFHIPETSIDVPHGRDGLSSYEEGVARRDVDSAFADVARTVTAEAINSVEAAKWAAEYTQAVVELRENYQQSNWTLAA